MKLLFYVGLFSLMLLTLPFLRFSSTIAFIDVGQGDSIFLQSPFRKETILIDTGGKLPFEGKSGRKVLHDLLLKGISFHT